MKEKISISIEKSTKEKLDLLSYEAKSNNSNFIESLIIKSYKEKVKDIDGFLKLHYDSLEVKEKKENLIILKNKSKIYYKSEPFEVLKIEKSFYEKESLLKKEVKKGYEFGSFELLEKFIRELVEEIFIEDYILISNWNHHNAYDEKSFTVKDLTSNNYSFNINFYIVEASEDIEESFVLESE